MALVIAYNRVVISQVLGFEVTLQQAVYNVLTAAGIGAPVYDDVPQHAAFPYVTIGDDALADWSADDYNGMTGTITVHTWSRQRGRLETKTLQGAIYDALHRATLAGSGYNFVTVDLLTTESFMDPDGKTRHGVQTFNVIFERL